MARVELTSESKALLAILGENLRQARIRRKWDVIEVKKATGLARNVILNIENGETANIHGHMLLLELYGLQDQIAAIATAESDHVKASSKPKRLGKSRSEVIDNEF